MKLRNKKTGEIVEYISFKEGGGEIAFYAYDTAKHYFYKSLAEFNEEWEDYKKPKVGYLIDPMDEDCVSADDDCYEECDVERAKELGLWFETKEEAEKAVEKLKAWERLKDGGFEITGWKFTPDMKHIKGNFVTIKAEIPYIVKNQADLDLLFGGGE